MKKLFLVFLALALTAGTFAQNATQARKILDKTAAIVGRKGGASANFSVSGKYGNSSGTISIKGNKFNARTSQAIVWYDGKTQWTYMKNSQEVNVSTPTEAQQQSMNPYKFINIYKNGFKLGMKNVSGGWQIHLYATNQKRTIKEMYIRQELLPANNQNAPKQRLDNHKSIQLQGEKPERRYVPLQLKGLPPCGDNRP